MIDDKKKKLLESLNKAIKRESEYEKRPTQEKPKEQPKEKSFLDEVFSTASQTEDAFKQFGAYNYALQRKLIDITGAPGKQMYEGLNKLGSNPIEGSLEIGNSLMGLVSAPFGIADALVRELPGGNTIADFVASPFETTALGVVEGQKGIQKGLESLGYPKPDKEKEMLSALSFQTGLNLTPKQIGDVQESLSQFNQGASQFLLGGVGGKLGVGIKSKLGIENVPELKVSKDVKQTIEVGDVGLDKLTDLPKTDKLAELRQKLLKTEQEALKKEVPAGFTEIKPPSEVLESKIGFKEVKPPSKKLELKTEKKLSETKEAPKVGIDLVKEEAIKIMTEDPSLTSMPKKIVNKLNAMKNEGKIDAKFNVENVRTWANEFNEARKQKLAEQKTVTFKETPVEDLVMRGFYGKNADATVGSILKKNPEYKPLIEGMKNVDDIAGVLRNAETKKFKMVGDINKAGGRYEGVKGDQVQFTNEKTGGTFSLKVDEVTKEKVQEVFANDKIKPLEGELPSKGTKEELAKAFQENKVSPEQEKWTKTINESEGFAVKLKNGDVINDKNVTNHTELIEKKKIKPDDIEDTGFVYKNEFLNVKQLSDKIKSESKLEKKLEVKEAPKQGIDLVKEEAIKIMTDDPSLTSMPKKIVNKLNAMKNEGKIDAKFNVENVRTWANEFNEARKQKLAEQKTVTENVFRKYAILQLPPFRYALGISINEIGCAPTNSL